MSKIVSINFVKNEEHCIEKMLNSVQPYVSDSYILVDNKTTDNTAIICKDRGCIVDFFDFENFGKLWNILLNITCEHSDWVFAIAPDETISNYFGELINQLVDISEESNIDGFWFPRRHWADLSMTKVAPQDKGWYPDKQLRLIRNDYPRIYLKNYVHEYPCGLRNSLYIDSVEINHFNMYYKPIIDYNFDKMNTLYNTLSIKQKEDGGKNIWP